MVMYDSGRQTGIIREVNNGVVEVKEIHLVLHLKLMKVVQKAKAEYSMRLNECCWKPQCVEQLPTTSGDISRVAHTVLNDHLVDTSEVEDSELVFFRGVWACDSHRVTELYREAERTKEHFVEELPIPSLRAYLVKRSNGVGLTNLNAMEGELRVVIEETIFAMYVTAEAVFAPECPGLLADRAGEGTTAKTI